MHLCVCIRLAPGPPPCDRQEVCVRGTQSGGGGRDVEASRVAGACEAGVGALTPSGVTAPSGCRHVNTFQNKLQDITEQIKQR